MQDGLLTLLGSQAFLMNCLATYAVVHVARANLFVIPLEKRRWAKLAVDAVNLLVGSCVSLALHASGDASVNVVVGLIAALFSAQVYNTVKRYLPEKLGGENDEIIVRREEQRKNQEQRGDVS